MKIIIITLIINTILTLAYIFIDKHGRQRYLLALLFFMVPVFGFALFLTPRILHKIIKNNSPYDCDLINSTDEENFAMKPKMEEELNIIPFEEALAVSTAGEKRGLLLEILKNDMEGNYKITKSALSDKDSETAHYAAAAAMEIMRKIRNKVLKIENEFLSDKDNLILRREYIDAVYEYIDSDVLSDLDRRININKYVNLMDETIRQYKSMIIQQDYIHQIGFLIESGRLYDAEKLARERKMECEDEDIYMKLMEIYYRLNDKVQFQNVLNELRRSKIVLSAKGMDMIRFWIDRR